MGTGSICNQESLTSCDKKDSNEWFYRMRIYSRKEGQLSFSIPHNNTQTVADPMGELRGLEPTTNSQLVSSIVYDIKSQLVLIPNL